MSTTRHDAYECPKCGTSNDAATGLTTNNGPQPGDLSLCAYCAWPSVFDVENGVLGQRSPTDDEWREIETDPDVIVARVRIETHKVLRLFEDSDGSGG